MTLSMTISNITKVAIVGLLTFAATTSAQAQASVNQKEFGQEYIDAIAVATPYVSKRRLSRNASSVPRSSSSASRT